MKKGKKEEEEEGNKLFADPEDPWQPEKEICKS